MALVGVPDGGGLRGEFDEVGGEPNNILVRWSMRYMDCEQGE